MRLSGLLILLRLLRGCVMSPCIIGGLLLLRLCLLLRRRLRCRCPGVSGILLLRRVRRWCLIVLRLSILVIRSRLVSVRVSLIMSIIIICRLCLLCPLLRLLLRLVLRMLLMSLLIWGLLVLSLLVLRLRRMVGFCGLRLRLLCLWWLRRVRFLIILICRSASSFVLRRIL